MNFYGRHYPYQNQQFSYDPNHFYWQEQRHYHHYQYQQQYQSQLIGNVCNQYNPNFQEPEVLRHPGPQQDKQHDEIPIEKKIEIVTSKLKDQEFQQIIVLNDLNIEQVSKLVTRALESREAQQQILEFIKTSPRRPISKILDKIIQKTKNQTKSREENIKFIIRKAFRFIYLIIKKTKDTQINLKTAFKVIQQQYFDKEPVELFLPFRKQSELKTMNQQFLKQIFNSDEFVEAYSLFLEQFDQMVLEDKKRKIHRLSEQVLDFLKSKKKKIDIKRVPWSVDNLEKLSYTAQSLLNLRHQEGSDMNQQ